MRLIIGLMLALLYVHTGCAQRILIVDEAKIRQNLELAGHSIENIDTLIAEIGADHISIPTTKAVVDFVADLGGLDTAYVAGDSLFLVQGGDTIKLKFPSMTIGQNELAYGDADSLKSSPGLRYIPDSLFLRYTTPYEGGFFTELDCCGGGLWARYGGEGIKTGQGAEFTLDLFSDSRRFKWGGGGREYFRVTSGFSDDLNKDYIGVRPAIGADSTFMQSFVKHQDSTSYTRILLATTSGNPLHIEFGGLDGGASWRYRFPLISPTAGKILGDSDGDGFLEWLDSSLNGLFSSDNDGGNIPSGMDVNLGDSLVLKKSNFGTMSPSLVLEHSTSFFGEAGGLAINIDPAQEAALPYFVDYLKFRAGNDNIFDVRYFQDVGIALRARDTIALVLSSAQRSIVLAGETFVQIGAQDVATNTDSVMIEANLDYSSEVDSLLGITPSGKVSKYPMPGGGITLDTVLVQSDTLIDWNSKNFKVIQLDMTSVTSITLEFANPTDPLFGTLHFRNVSGTDSVTFPGNVYWMDETSVGTLNITQSGKYTMVYDGENYYME